MTKHRIAWLAARCSLAEFLALRSQEAGNEEAASFFWKKLASLEADRPDSVDDEAGNDMFWEFISEFDVIMGNATTK